MRFFGPVDLRSKNAEALFASYVCSEMSVGRLFVTVGSHVLSLLVAKPS